MKSTEVGAYWERNARAWTELSRAGYDIYRDKLNTPAFLAMLPDISGLRGLDLGCGEGTNTRRLAECGARITAVDISPSLVAAARAVEATDPRAISLLVGDAAQLAFADDCFDFATAFMSLMDMPVQDAALGEIYRVLKKGGFLQFSILHPCFAPPWRKTIRRADGEPCAIEIADYFSGRDGEIDRWTFTAAPPALRERYRRFEIPRFHRTLSDWMTMLIATGFVVEAMQEPMADAETARNFPKLADTRIAPSFLHLRVRKKVALSDLGPIR